MTDDRITESEALDARIAAARRAADGDAPARPAKGYAQGSRVLAELIGAPLGGGLLGWALDRWLGTSPWFLLVLLVLSVAVAFRNIIRMSKDPVE